MAWIFLIITLLLNVNIMNCLDDKRNKDDPDNHVDVPLVSRLDAPLKAELDITELTKQIKSLISTETKKGIEQAINSKLETELQSVKDDLGLQITNTLLTSLKTLKEQNEQHLETVINSTTQEIRRRIDELSNKQVALSACAGTSGGFELNGNTLKFPVITTAIGISGLSTFTSSGQFVCEYSGLYHITVVIMCSKNNSLFSIYKNQSVIATGFIPVFDSKQGWHTGISSVTTLLDKNDRISVNVAGLTSDLYGDWSCIDIVKVN